MGRETSALALTVLTRLGPLMTQSEHFLLCVSKRFFDVASQRDVEKYVPFPGPPQNWNWYGPGHHGGKSITKSVHKYMLMNYYIHGS